MIRVAFICHGNICRSPLAEFLFINKLKEKNLQDEFYVESFGTSYEEHNNPVYPPVKSILARLNIDCSKKRAQTIIKSQYDDFDYFICMDSQNLRNLMRIFNEDKEKKVYKLLDFAYGGDVADPYYYGGFDKVKEDIESGLDGLLKFFSKK